MADNSRMVGFSLTPGYETYAGLGWYGVIVQDMEQTARNCRALSQ
jgi:hypothetical protein